MLHRDAPFAGDDLHSEHIFNKIIDGMGCDFLRQSGHKFLQKIVDVQNQCFSVQIAHALHRPQFVALRKSAFRSKLLGCSDRLKPNDTGNGLQMVAAGCLLKGLDAAYGKGGFAHRLIDDPDTTSLHGLHIAVCGQLGNGAAHRIAGTIIFFNQGILAGQQGLVWIILRFDALFDAAVDALILCFRHGDTPQLVQTFTSVYRDCTRISRLLFVRNAENYQDVGDFLEIYLTCMNKLAILKLQDKVV
jgi:hypothetical protein